jgi:DNA-binding MltR family transcriptional regulator
MIVTAELDRILSGFIQSLFRNELTRKEEQEIFTGTGPLAPFAAKIRLCYALGCYGPITRQNLLEVSRIRNHFAHSALPITFRTPQIRAACKKLNILQTYMDADLVQRERYDITKMTTRETFVLTALVIGIVTTGQTAERYRGSNQELQAILEEFKRRKATKQDVSAFTEWIEIP